ncbi:hypothetical protein [Gracilibacillus sp. YIM 98692]|uniref:hypothetical protein n=1 Tax=Gracilibacillus sp. YIM 98692 TaxID=2663532 RepID=UPI0013D7E276|nr:hypothetical protein [Gracilibacillus sp. YIM 98692]
MVKVLDILINSEKEAISEIRESMNNTWTKKGGDRYHQQIINIIEEAKERYQNKKDHAW